MTQDEIIRMAREAGLPPSGGIVKFAALVAAHEKKFWMEQIEVECNEAVLAEREACAKVCDEEAASWARLNAQDEEGYGAIQCAAAIRARSNT